MFAPLKESLKEALLKKGLEKDAWFIEICVLFSVAQLAAYGLYLNKLSHIFILCTCNSCFFHGKKSL